MGIDYSGGMIVGEKWGEVESAVIEKLDDDELDFRDWLDDMGMSDYSEYYDADTDHSFVGFEIPDTPMSDIDEWLIAVKEKATKFEELTGVKARLVGMQNIW